MGALPGTRRGAADDLVLAFVLAAVVLYQGAEVESYNDQPVVVGVVKPDSPASARGHPDGRPHRHRRGPPRRHVGKNSSLTVGTRANREVQLGLLRQGVDVSKSVTPISDDKAKFEIGDIGVLPDVHPHLLGVTAGEPGGESGAEAWRCDCRRQWRARDVRSRVPADHPQEREHAGDRVDSPQRRAGHVVGDAPAERQGRLHRRAAERRHEVDQAVGRRRNQAERAEERADGRHDRSDRVGIAHAPALAQQLDGPDRDRAGVRRIGASSDGSRWRA